MKTVKVGQVVLDGVTRSMIIMTAFSTLFNPYGERSSTPFSCTFIITGLSAPTRFSAAPRLL